MNWYPIAKYLHIITAMLTIGGIFARQLVRGFAQRSDDIKEVASLVRMAIRLDRMLVIPASNVLVIMGIILAVMLKWPVFGFLQGATQNWLLISNILLIAMMIMIWKVFIPYNKKVDDLLQISLSKNLVTPELHATLSDKRNQWAHHFEVAAFLLIAALMVLKPF